ncbi:MAG: hypothetical protein Ct9H300mP11_08070 [Chloroflexota bacterium]|nr:MAG: hypothetical protein Ct9H300mP11_08070 [Chloroflexota bacterium]
MESAIGRGAWIGVLGMEPLKKGRFVKDLKKQPDVLL